MFFLLFFFSFFLGKAVNENPLFFVVFSSLERERWGSVFVFTYLNKEKEKSGQHLELLLLNCCSIHSLVTDFGRSKLNPKEREIVKFDNTPIARDMPNNTV